jgi:hypothetical protein
VKNIISEAGVRSGELYSTARGARIPTAEKHRTWQVQPIERDKRWEGSRWYGTITEATKLLAEVVGRKMQNTGKAIRPSDGDSQ